MARCGLISALLLVGGRLIESSDIRVDVDDCTLYLAPSIIPGGGLGMFTTIALPGLHELYEWPADIILPYSSDSKDDTYTRLGLLYNYVWGSNLAEGGKEHPLVQYQEGSSWTDQILGYGSIANSDAHYHNIEHSTDRNSYVDQWDRPHIGTDAYTPFHHAFAQTLSKAS